MAAYFTINGVHISYPQLFKKGMYEGKETKYGTEVIVPKDSAAAKLLKKKYDEMVAEALESKKLTRKQITPWIKPMGPRAMGVVKDCDEDPDCREEFKGCYIVHPQSNRKPGVFNRQQEPIDEKDADEVYGGCICNVCMQFYAYTANGGGISLNLNGVQKWEDDTAYGAPRPSVTDMFGNPLDEDDYD